MADGYPGGRGPAFKPRRTSSRHAPSPSSAYENRSRSLRSIILSSASVSKFMTRVQYDLSTRTTGAGGIFAGLDQGEQFEQLIERAETTRESDQCVRPHREMQLAHREIVKLKGEIRRRIGIRLLCVRKPDIESY